MTKIPWTEKTWNPVVGCTMIAEGCKNCYARRLHNQRHKAYLENKKMPIQYAYPFHRIQILDDRPSSPQNRLEYPLHWIKPRKIFVCSMGDLFHPKVPIGFQLGVYETITDDRCQQHAFQILTKRPMNMLDFHQAEVVGALPNLWLGTSISTQADADKNIPILLQIPAAVRFVSIEPMLEVIKPRIEWIGKIHWAIIGTESGPNRRKVSIDDVRETVGHWSAECAVFLKQIEVDGKCSKNPKEWPEDLRIQEYPI